MATIPTPEQGKPILDFSSGTFDGSSYLFQSRNGATEHVSGDDVADYVNTSRIYNNLETEVKTPVGAINEIKAQEESDIADVQAAIDEVVAKVATLTGSMDCSYADSSTIGYRSILSESVDLATLPNYPTGHTILGFAVAYAYVGNEGDYYHIAQLNIVGTNVHCNAKIAGTVRFAIRVIYI